MLMTVAARVVVAPRATVAGLATFPHASLGPQNTLAAGLFLGLVTDAFLRRDAMLRAATCPDTYVWADEIQDYCTDDVLTIFGQTRKFGLRFCAVTTTLSTLVALADHINKTKPDQFWV